MTDDKLYALLEAFTVYYWSVPVSYVTGRIMAWHPEVTEKQIKSALRSKRAQNYHFSVESEGLKEPEIAVEHLVAVDYDCFERFIAARLRQSSLKNADSCALISSTSSRMPAASISERIFGTTTSGSEVPVRRSVA